MTTNNAINSHVGNRIYSLSPYIVGIDELSQFTTIQSAINKAVTDGASSSNQKTIFIKNGVYTENLTLSDGINLKGFEYNAQSFTMLNSSATINGSITISAASQNTMVGISVIPTTSVNCINLQGSGEISLTVKECLLFPGGGSNVVFNINSTADLALSMSDCFVASTVGIFTHNDNTAKIFNITIDSSLLLSQQQSLLDGTGLTLIMNAYNSKLSTSFNLGSITQIADATSNFYNSIIIGDGDGDAFYMYNQLGEGTVYAINSTINLSSGTLFDNSINSSPVSQAFVLNCTSIQDVANNLKPSTPQGTLDYLNDAQEVAVRKFKTAVSGFSDAEGVAYSNGFVHTTNATSTPIVSVPIGVNRSAIVRASIVANVDNMSDHMGATITFCAFSNGTTTTIIGTPTIVYYRTAGILVTATVTASGSHTSALINALGVLATNVSWACSYSAQYISTSA